MDVSIMNFRSVKNAVFSFKKGTNLLKGPSGCGKTTIFEAVKWCLFGNMKNIFPRSPGIKLRTKVEIYFLTTKIIRTNQPEKVIVLIEGKKFEGTDAKDRIKIIFGTRSLWETCSYLSQGERNFLLQTSQREKTEIIKELLFDMSSEDSEWYKDKFEKYKLKLKNTNQSKFGEIEILKRNLDPEQEPDKKEISKAEKRKSDLDLYDKISKKYDTNTRKIQEYEKFRELEHIMKKSKTVLDSYPKNMSQEVFDNWSIYVKLKEKLDSIEKCKETNLSREELLLEKEITKNNHSILEKLGIDDPSSVKNILDEKMEMIKNSRSEQLIFEKIEKKKNTEKLLYDVVQEHEKLSKKVEKDKKKQIYQSVSEDDFFCEQKYMVLKQRYQEISDGKTRKCPSCGKELLLDHHNELKEIDQSIDIDNSRAHIKSIQKIKKHIDNLSEKNREKEQLEKKLLEYKDVEDNREKIDFDIDLLQEQCKLLSQYREVKEKEIEECLNFLEKRNISRQMEDIFHPIYEKLEYPGEPKKYIQDFIKAKKDYDNSSEFLGKFSIIDEQQYENKKQKGKVIEKEIKKLDRVKEVLIWKDVKDRRLLIGKNNELILKAQILSEKIETLVNQNLEMFLTDFNNMINDILFELFEDMSIKLTLFKTGKMTKKTKPTVNIEITYKSEVFDSFSTLSGGEKDRLSLAFTLVFSKLCNSKFIFLDECMSSLDEGLRQKCLDIIKRNGKDRVIINVCHETVEGYYDNIVDIS
jgi:DNA repair exonuclease SbcCD ATPase subunit